MWHFGSNYWYTIQFLDNTQKRTIDEEFKMDDTVEEKKSDGNGSTFSPFIYH